MTRRTVLPLLLTATIVTLSAVTPALAKGRHLQPSWSGVKRVVAVGDVHGAFPELLSLLQGVGLLSPDLQWVGGTTHLVMLGDIVDRGPDSRQVLDLLITLQPQAERAGGRLHVLLGNHEVMNLTGDLRYVSAEELQSYAADEDPKERSRSFQRLLDREQLSRKERQERLAQLELDYPQGYYALQHAFSPKGRYGRWLLEQQVLVLINDVVFVHAGLGPALLEVEPDKLNRKLLGELREIIEAREILLARGMLEPEMPRAVQWNIVDRLLSELRSTFNIPPALRRVESAAHTMRRLRESMLFLREGPVWYRGTSLHPEVDEKALSKRVLKHLGARAVVVGHTPVHTHRITTRLGGTVIRADTGMLHSHYKGRAAAVVIEDPGLFAFYPEEGLSPLPTTVLGLGDALMLADAQIEVILRDAEVVEIEDVGAGTTQPRRLVLSHSKRRYRAIFKDVDRQADPAALAGTTTDRYRYEAAAYRIDRLLGLGLVPPTVLRTVNGREGSVQLWIEDAISEKDRRWEDLEPPDQEHLRHELQRMHVLDLLIHNVERDESNMLVTTRDWKLYLIDHSRAFAPGLPTPHEPPLRDLPLDEEGAARPQALDARTLRHALGRLLGRTEREAVLERRDLILEHAADPDSAPEHVVVPAPTDAQISAQL